MGNSDDYEIIRRIGKGKYGEVFECFNITNNKRCAIKVLKPIKEEKVLREINILNTVRNGPNIIKLTEVIVNHGIPSLVFKYISEINLKDCLMDFNEQEIKFYLFKLLRAIDYAHSQVIVVLFFILLSSNCCFIVILLFCFPKLILFFCLKGVIHRDIKPLNVMIERNRKVLKLVDWGLAEFYANQNSFSVFVASRHQIIDFIDFNYILDFVSIR